jgi:hypothetical protein
MLAAAGLMLAAGCGPTSRTAADAVLPYLEAVQAEDLDELFCLSAGAREAEELGSTVAERREAFEAWAGSQYEAYLEGRDAGLVEPEGHGITLVKLFSLGRGTFFTIGAVRPAGEGGMTVRTHLRFGYRRINLSGMSPGTTFYLCGAPAGVVHPVRVPSRPREVSLEVLESVSVDWTLVRSEPSGECPGGWNVVSAVPVEGSEQSTTMTWEF